MNANVIQYGGDSTLFRASPTLKESKSTVAFKISITSTI